MIFKNIKSRFELENWEWTWGVSLDIRDIENLISTDSETFPSRKD